MTLAIAIIAVVVLFILGTPVAFVMGLVSSWWLVYVDGFESFTLAQRIYFSVESFPLVALPLFVIMGVLAERTGALPDMVRWLQMLIGQFRGGLAYINTLSSMLLAGISGTATADIASIGRIQIQMMRRAGYSLEYATSLTAASAMIGPIIPPSVVMIVYALAVGQISIGGLFMAGVLPGLLLAAGLMAMSSVKAFFEPDVEISSRPSWRPLVRQTVRIVPILVLPVIIVGGTVSGIFTVTEASAVGVMYTLGISIFSKRRLKLQDIFEAVVYSAKISSVAGMLFAAGALLSYVFSINMVTVWLTDFMMWAAADALMLMIIMAIVLLIIGMFIDAMPVIIALAPLMAPIGVGFGIPEYQFAMVFLVSALIGIVTPPAGMILFMASSIGNITVERLSIAISPFVIWMICVVFLIAYFPSLTTYLPQLTGF